MKLRVILPICAALIAIPVAAAVGGAGGNGCASKTLAATETDVQVAEGAVKGVYVGADWCGTCKALEPKLDALKASAAAEGVTFVELDYTARDEAAFLADAAAADIGDQLTQKLEAKIKTGRLYLIDTASGSIVATLGPSMSVEEMETTLTSTKGSKLS